MGNDVGKTKLPFAVAEPSVAPTHQPSVEAVVIGCKSRGRVLSHDLVTDAFVVCESDVVGTERGIGQQTDAAQCQEGKQQPPGEHAFHVVTVAASIPVYSRLLMGTT